MKLRALKLGLCLAVALVGALVWRREERFHPVSAQTNSGGPTNSGPIAITPDDKQVWAVNPDNASVSVLNVESDANQKVAEIEVGQEPNNLAISPNGRTVYVANTVSGTVSVIDAGTREIAATITVGTEPYGLALTPNGSKLYVANARSNDVSVINTSTNRVVKTITGVGDEPRGVAITSDGDADDSDEKVYVTQFLAVDRPNTIIGADNYKEGHVTVINAGTDTVAGQVTLPPMADVGFNSNGSPLQGIPPANPPVFTTKTGAFPNTLNAIVIKGQRAYVPNNAASPDGPVRFNVNVQAFLNVIDTATDQEGVVNNQPQSINMNRGINFEPPGEKKLFLGMPWHIAFEHNSNVGYVLAMGSNILVKVNLDENGTPTINAPKQAGDPGNVIRIPVGQKPIGLAINSTDSRAYIINEVSRDISVVDLGSNRVTATVSAAALPAPGTLEATVQYGKAVFFTAAGVNLPTLGPVIPPGRVSSEGWSGCVSCHANGTTDGVVWIFGTGPRRSLPLNATFNPHNPNDQKILNYSAVNDEIQDFEANMRNTQGGLGLIDGGINTPLGDPNGGRSVPLDALKEFIARGIRTPISPLRKVNPFSQDARDLAQGRQLFADAGCVTCHGGGGWSVARRNYTPPPPATDVVRAQLFRTLRQVGTFNPANKNEIRETNLPPLGADGYAPPSLLGAWAFGPLFHNGSAITIDQVLDNATHRRAGKNVFDKDLLNDPENRRALIKFLKSIDASTPPFTGFSPLQ
jgi:YVTN family beta-propeller protein